jgi:hypothetical protein
MKGAMSMYVCGLVEYRGDEARSLGTPEGAAALLRDTSGNELASLRVDRPKAMDEAYADPANPHAVRTADRG